MPLPPPVVVTVSELDPDSIAVCVPAMLFPLSALVDVLLLVSVPLYVPRASVPDTGVVPVSVSIRVVPYAPLKSLPLWINVHVLWPVVVPVLGNAWSVPVSASVGSELPVS